MRGPVDITGLPRTGTTALANTLSLDPQFRCLRGWEQTKPCPPPILAEEATDPRRLQAASENELLPAELKAMHLYELDATMEDTDLLGMAFHGQQMTLPVEGYRTWWRGADLTDTYHYHRRVVKLLESQRPPDLWLFKAPHHKFHLEAIVSAYPEARFVMTHRDPAKVVPSYASIVSAILPPADGQRDLHRLGREISEHLRVGMESAIAARARIGEDRFLDVQQRELIVDSPWAPSAGSTDWLWSRAHAADVEQADPQVAASRTAQVPNGTHHYTAGAVRARHRADPFRLRLLHLPLRRARWQWRSIR